MNIKNEGAKEARQVIKKFHECLNSPRLVPEQCYRRNHTTYPLVSYINQITGLYLSKNYHAIPIFIKRAHDALDLRGDLVSEPYRKIVVSYLSQIAYFITEFHCFEEDDEHLKGYIPVNLIENGKQEPPPIEFWPNEF
jgi:hypothetical protein